MQLDVPMANGSDVQGAALEGVKVLELCSLVAGPFCTKLLADMGADVVKTETPDGGDEARRRGPFHNSHQGIDTSLLFTYVNSNKRGITLNLDTPKGREILLELVKRVDLLVEDLPSGEMDRLGLSASSLHQANPGLLLTSISPFGRSGPYRDYKAYYLNTYHSGGDGYLLPGGWLADKLYPEREPIKAGGYLGEYQAVFSAAIASMAAFLGRAMDGQGGHIDVSKQESLINLNAADFCRYPDAGYMESRYNRHLTLYIGGQYGCKDGFWQLVIQGQRQWEAMITVMGSPPWASEEKYATHASCVTHRAEVDEKIEEWAMGHTREEIFHALQREGCAAGPVYSTDEVLQDRQLEYREFFVEMEHPSIGKFKAPSAAYKLSQTPWAVRRPAPTIGQHNVEIYGGWLGYEGESLAHLRQARVI